MARGEPPGSGPPLRDRPSLRDRPPLPAPYRSPWSGLADALRAVAADLRLTLQRLWRRNGEGDLPLPPAWPRRLAPLFWPLLLVTTLALLTGLGSRLLSGSGGAPPPATSGDGAASGALPPPNGASLGADRTTRSGVSVASGMGSAGDDDPVTAGLPATDPARSGAADSGRPAGQPAAPPAAATDGALTRVPSDTARAPDAEATAELRLDPLLELLVQGEDAGLLLAARPDPAASRLSLTLSQAATALPPAQLLERAQRWQQRARDAGYERLELRDAEGRLRGRGALVGSGMILLAPVPGS